MSYKQNLLNAQVSVNRCVFEMNKKDDEINKRYLINEAEQAIKDLNKAIDLLDKEL